MWFKNLQIYRLPKNWNITAAQLEEQLSRCRFAKCGPMDPQSRGWTPPNGDCLSYTIDFGRYISLSLAVEQKLLPSSVVNQVAQERAADIAEQQGYTVGRKQMRELKDRIYDELLPHAFTRLRRTNVWIDTNGGWLVIDASTGAKADEAIEMLGKSMDEFPVSRLRTNLSPTAAMTEWLAGGGCSDIAFTIDRDCEMKLPVEEKSAVRYVRHTLEGDDVRQHLADGKLPTRLALTWNDRLSFVLTDKLEIKRVAFLDVVKADRDAENSAEQFDADLAIMSGEFSRFLPAVVEALGGEAQ